MASTPSDLSDIMFRIVDQSRFAEVLSLLYSNFHTDEPMSRALKIYDGVHRLPDVDAYTLRALGENLSIMAIDPITDKLLGVCINGLVKKTDEYKEHEFVDPKFIHIINVLHGVNMRAGDIFDIMSTDTIFDIKMVATDKENRRGGLATDLLRRSVKLARNLGYTAAKTEATGALFLKCNVAQ